MIYLIQSVYKDDNDNYHDILKIGYTSNLEKRLSHYTSHNFGFKLLKTREGNEELEKLLHYYFNKYLIKESHNREWFEYNEEIINEFEKLEKEELSFLKPNKKIKNQKEQLVIDDDFLLELCKNNLDLFNELKIFLNTFNNIDKNFRNKMKSYCLLLENINCIDILKKIPCIPNNYHRYYELLGHKDIRANSYDEYLLRKKIFCILKNPETKDALLFFFQPGNKFTKKVAKEKLQEIYDQLGFKKKAKAADLEEYFELRRVKIKNSILNKYDEGFEIISLK